MNMPDLVPMIPLRPRPMTRTRIRERLLDAGMQLFAERGFDGATVRAIVAQAEANEASINYHFGSKQQFHVDVLCHAYRETVGRSTWRIDDRCNSAADLQLLLSQLPHVDRGRWFIRLLAWELVHPTGALRELWSREIRLDLQGSGVEDRLAVQERIEWLWLIGQRLLMMVVQAAVEQRLPGLPDQDNAYWFIQETFARMIWSGWAARRGEGST
jgi:AcrR family transcriptional regulator